MERALQKLIDRVQHEVNGAWLNMPASGHYHKESDAPQLSEAFCKELIVQFLQDAFLDQLAVAEEVSASNDD